MVDKKLFRFILLFYGFATLYAVVTAMLQKYSGLTFQSNGYIELLVNQLYNYVAKFIFIFFSILLAEHLIKRKIKLIYSLLIHTFMSVLLTVYSALSLLAFEKYIIGIQGAITSEIVISRVAYASTFNFFIYFTIIILVHAYHYLRTQKEDELKRSNLKTQLLDSKISALQSQLQPHFLFNALNDISSLMEMNIEKAQNAIADLSDMLRFTLGIKNSKFITLEEELKILNKYLSLEKIRFDDKLKIQLSISEDLLKHKTPAFLLQPLVENAIKHGFSYDNDTINIIIKVYIKDDMLVFEVFNDGKLLENETVNYGNGISNILLRLDTLFTDEYIFEFSNTKDLKGVQTLIKIPFS